MTKYARDEFDKIPETASRQGVHRSASAPSRRKLWPILAVGMVALAIGLVSFLILPKLGIMPGGTQASSSLESAALPQSGADPSASADSSASPQPSAVQTSESAKPEPSPTPSATPSSAVDKTQGVAVYNASGTAGLAGRVSSTIQTDGWTLGQVGNWGGAPQQTSVIFYAGPAQKANAEALSALLNIPTLVDSAEFQVPVVVVLGPGFP
ncbi:LytR C-terminal domain-containing protein [Arthrobacter sp. D1-29]